LGHLVAGMETRGATPSDWTQIEALRAAYCERFQTPPISFPRTLEDANWFVISEGPNVLSYVSWYPIGKAEWYIGDLWCVDSKRGRQALVLLSGTIQRGAEAAGVDLSGQVAFTNASAIKAMIHRGGIIDSVNIRVPARRPKRRK
jgi:hypothetical protein